MPQRPVPLRKYPLVPRPLTGRKATVPSMAARFVHLAADYLSEADIQGETDLSAIRDALDIIQAARQSLYQAAAILRCLDKP